MVGRSSASLRLQASYKYCVSTDLLACTLMSAYVLEHGVCVAPSEKWLSVCDGYQFTEVATVGEMALPDSGKVAVTLLPQAGERQRCRRPDDAHVSDV